ncbi:hypothetical protein G5V59_03875 [Nocardioides sp. W3-2-3]|uniref:hypothetical protein n=1 Tax=Nocardioides convexus TaxID=2712224 RepID=UPI002418B0F9|nr:hypothetical protein [Nocardioides convexus]NGZ99771.1 hypothetical protein [Nocardioides convexus]
MTNKIGLIVAGAVAAVLLVAGGVTALVVSGGDPTSVQEVADAAVDAAQDLDVDQGIDLLCETPSKKDRHDLEALISEAQDEAGTKDPDVDYKVSNVKGDKEGSFDVTITSDEDAFKDETIAGTVTVATVDGRSCITGFESRD